MQLFSDFLLEWTIAEPFIQMTFTAGNLSPGRGFVGFGLGKPSMSEVDIIWCYLLESGAPRCEDAYSEFFHPYADTDFGGKSDIDPNAVTTTFLPKGRISFKFQRLLVCSSVLTAFR